MNLTDEEIRIKVAESLPVKEAHWWCPRCGEVHANQVTFTEHHGIDSCMERVTWVESPNYPESLDACAEFEKDAPREYWRKLSASVEPVDSSPIGLAIAVAKATARQRCLAYLRMKGILP